MLKGGADKRTRDAIGQAIASSLYTLNPPLDAADDVPPGSDVIVQKLRKTGFSSVHPIFSPQVIDDIHAYFAQHPATFYNTGLDDPQAVKGSPAAPPTGFRFCEWEQDVISGCPAIAEAAHNPALLRIAEAYLDAPPTLTIVTCWWSFPSDSPPGGMQYYHHDRDDFRQLKFFAYLTPVTTKTGPHQYVDSTHTFAAVMDAARKRPGEEIMALLNWLEKHRKAPEELAAYLPSANIRTITGDRGASFFEDTRGLHRGVPPVSGPRFAFEICYALLPKHNTNYRPISRPPIGPVTAKVAYATRLFYRDASQT